ncbi:hypothetical protein BJ322DRAFT_1024130 [Thelephora terrestris]|uniref:Uncharacterized protein n=1 Tax=Thelephora terrestris TaxID=56493 RepID=A0A9P6H6V9_9AGAM|nr:hypothetical protein BJ322DRAFT_1024130 [Thelephora terrestris]
MHVDRFDKDAGLKRNPWGKVEQKSSAGFLKDGLQNGWFKLQRRRVLTPRKSVIIEPKSGNPGMRRTRFSSTTRGRIPHLPLRDVAQRLLDNSIPDGIILGRYRNAHFCWIWRSRAFVPSVGEQPSGDTGTRPNRRSSRTCRSPANAVTWFKLSWMGNHPHPPFIADRETKPVDGDAYSKPLPSKKAPPPVPETESRRGPRRPNVKITATH